MELIVGKASDHLTSSHSGAWLPVNGVLTWFPANTPLIEDGGLWSEPTGTNKSTTRNANPIESAGTVGTNLSGVVNLNSAGGAILSIVDDTAELAAAGLLGIATAGKVFKLDASAATGETVVVFSGQVGNLNSHTGTLFVRGLGSARLTINTEGANVALPAAYTRWVTANITPISTTRELYLRIAAGSVARFILDDLVDLPFATSPIVVAGAAVQRTGPRNVISGLDLTYGVAGFVKWEQRAPSVTSSFTRILEFNDGSATNFMNLYDNGGNTVVATKTISGVGGATGATPWGSGDTKTAAFAFAADGAVMLRMVGGSQVQTNIPGALNALNRLALGGRGFDALRNNYALTKSLSLIYGTPERPANQALFDEVYAKAVAS